MSYLAYLRHDAPAIFVKETGLGEPEEWILLSEVKRQLRQLDAREGEV